uniref:BTB_2 domain-containing protein n=1 Tax=Macrostomum lignano TaxID=282301 RepID=A0A1I8JRQ3_9PLAT
WQPRCPAILRKWRICLAAPVRRAAECQAAGQPAIVWLGCALGLCRLLWDRLRMAWNWILMPPPVTIAMLYVPSYMSPSGGLGTMSHSREDLSMSGGQARSGTTRGRRISRKNKFGVGGDGGGSSRRTKAGAVRVADIASAPLQAEAAGDRAAENEDNDEEEEAASVVTVSEGEDDNDNRQHRSGSSGFRRVSGISGGIRLPRLPPAGLLRAVRLNVSGMHFETRLGVLTQHPQHPAPHPAGNPQKRARYFDRRSHEYFFDRHRPTFEAVFNYYQYGGKLKRPPTVTDDIFPLEFYEIEREVIDAYKKDEGYISETVVLPSEHPFKRAVWMLFEYPETSAPAFLIAIVSVVFTILSIILFCAETLHEFKGTHCVPSGLPNFFDPFFVAESPARPGSPSSWWSASSSAPARRARSSARWPSCELSASSGCSSSTKHSADLQVLVLTFRASIEGLGLFLVALIVCILLFSSTIYYEAERVAARRSRASRTRSGGAVIHHVHRGLRRQGAEGRRWQDRRLPVCAVAGVLTLAIPVPIITENFNKFYTHKTGRGSTEVDAPPTWDAPVGPVRLPPPRASRERLLGIQDALARQEILYLQS